jgi:hypothetical protein
MLPQREGFSMVKAAMPGGFAALVLLTSGMDARQDWVIGPQRSRTKQRLPFHG